MVIGVDIGGTHFRIGHVNEAGAILGFEKYAIADIVQSDTISDIERAVSLYIDRYELRPTVRALAIGVPSCVSKNKSFIYSTPNLPGLNNIDLGAPLSQHFRLPVFIDRDVNYLLNNDIQAYNLDDTKEKNIIGIYVGTGIGNALYINGRFYTGKNGVAGELGHIPIPGSDKVCGCGNIGCSETLASGRYLEQLCKDTFKDISIQEIFVKKEKHPLVQDFLKTLAAVIATEINIIDPDYVILAGGVLTMENFPMETLMSFVKRHIRAPYPLNTITFIYPAYTQENGVRGGALLAFEYLKKQKLFNQQPRRKRRGMLFS